VPLSEARAAIARGAGTQFDPSVVDGLARIPDETLDRIRTEIA
jgi:response regulator RpfG family c-di-GMP phosphodiesterase